MNNLCPWDEAWNDAIREEAIVSDPLEKINGLYYDVLAKECLMSELNGKTSLKVCCMLHTVVRRIVFEFKLLFV